MLVLSRKSGERIVIGDNIEVEIVRISGDKVRLGILAPKEVIVLRKELANRPVPTILEPEDEPGVVRPIDETVRINDHC